MLDVDYLMCITKMNMISQLRQRVRQNGQATITAGEYDQLQREWITRTGAGLGDCHAELLEIHNIIMCIAECPPIKPTDTYTVRGVKEMAHRINEYEKGNNIIKDILTRPFTEAEKNEMAEIFAKAQSIRIKEKNNA